MKKATLITLMAAQVLTAATPVLADEVAPVDNLPVITETVPLTEEVTAPETVETTPSENLELPPVIETVVEASEIIPTEPSTPAPVEEVVADETATQLSQEVPVVEETAAEAPVVEENSNSISEVPQVMVPVVTETGVTIVGTQDSQVIVQYDDGSQETVAAETVGASVNPDKTVSVKTASGKMEVLPSTGEEDDTLLKGLGLLGLSLVGAELLRDMRKKQNKEK